MNSALFTSASCEWPTPQGFFDAVDREFGPFDLDACATPDNAKVATFHDAGDLWSSLAKPWTGRIWLNPPYGRQVTGQWIRKAYESAQEGALVVCLIPARTDTAWWHDYVMKAQEIRFVRGRLRFGDSKSGAPFPSALVIFNGVEGNAAGAGNTQKL